MYAAMAPGDADSFQCHLHTIKTERTQETSRLSWEVPQKILEDLLDDLNAVSNAGWALFIKVRTFDRPLTSSQWATGLNLKIQQLESLSAKYRKEMSKDPSSQSA